MEKTNIKEAPLTESLLGIYLECIDESNPATYLLPFGFTFPRDGIDAYKLADAFDKTANAYSAFSTVIKTVNSEPVMALFDGSLPKIRVINALDNEIAVHKKALFRPFCFDGGLLWRGEILLTPTKTVLLLVFHHTVFDGTSLAVFNDALRKAYNGEALCEDGTLFDAKAKEAEIFSSELARDAEGFFETYLDGIDADSCIMPDCEKQSIAVPKAKQYDVPLNECEIKAFALKNGVTENIVFLSAFAYALCKFNNQGEAVFSSVESGRFGGGYDNSIGMFVKTFPLRIAVNEAVNSSDFVKDTKANYFNVLKHNRTRFSGLVQNHPGIANVKYIYQGEIFKGIPVNGIVPEIDAIDSYESVSDLDAMIYKTNGEYKIWLGYKSDMYSEQLIDRFADFYRTVLAEITKDKKLCEIELTDDEGRKFIDSVNSTEYPYDHSLTVNGIFAETAEKYPDNTAVSYNGRRITYSELKTVTDKLAAYLIRKGIGKNDYVSVLIPRNEFMPICALGVIKAGAAYQPIDPTYPEERIKFMIADCKAKFLLCDRKLADYVTDYTGEILFTDEIAFLSKCEIPLPEVSPDDGFLLIYTSGTTGTPKGCLLENKNLVAFYLNHKRLVELSETSKVATIASFGFDAGAMDIFTTVMAGGELCIIPDEIKLDLPKVEQFYIENGITNGFMTTQLGRMFLEQTKCKTLRHFVVGGEKLVPFTPPEWIKCHNDYGPSETIAYVCGYEIQNDGIIQPIGKPNGNTKLYIVDSFNRLMPAGCCGELCIAGAQVGRCYINRPDKTAEAFVDNPFSDDVNYKRMYKTGDIVRLLPDGNFDFIGRRDGQVKIRGFRIELTEIEQVIRAFDCIKNATVQAYDDQSSGKFIAAFIVADTAVDIDALNAFILSQKPPYMVPAVTMQLDSIPVNANGKVDKKKLPKPERKFSETVKPENDAQQLIFDTVAEITGTREYGIDTDLYLTGLSSISSIKLCSALAKVFGKPVQISDIKRNNTVRKLDEFLSAAQSSDDTVYGVADDYPLTKNQEGIFVECMGKPGSTFYNIPLLIKLSPEIDLPRLKQAIADTVNAHPYIKTYLFTSENGNIRQKRNDDEPFCADDIDEIAFTDIEALKRTAVTPFELTGSRLFRFKLFIGADVYLFIEMHHIIADGASINILISDIEKAYGGERLAVEGFTGFDISADEERRRGTQQLIEAKAYYGSMLDGLDTGFLPGADRLPSRKRDSGRLELHSGKNAFNAVKAYCDGHKITVNGFLLGAFGFVLAKYAGTDYSVFNTIYNGRNDSRSASTVGMLVKTLPVVCRIDKSSTLEITKEIAASLPDSMANDIFSFAEICSEYGVKNDIVFVYQGDGFSFDSFCGCDASEVSLTLSEAKAPLTLEVSASDGIFNYIAEYSPDLFTEDLIKTVVGAFDRAIAEFTEDTDIKDISLLTGETLNALDEYNKTDVQYIASETIAELFMRQALRTPDNPCVVCNGKAYTYREAFERACRIALYIKNKGIGKNDTVAILINRDENMVFCVHGVSSAGAAYIGLDPSYPAERLNFMLNDSNTRLLIAERSLRALASEYAGEVLFTDEIDGLPSDTDSVIDGIKTISPDDNALIVYSSGTTGVPKGAVLPHRSIICFYASYKKDFCLGESSRTAMYAGFGFDGGAMDVFCSPMAGSALYIIPEDIRLDLEKLERFYVQNGITNGFMTTQMGAMFISNTKCGTLKYFQVGGEKFIPTVPPEWVTFYNGYGPSETMCYVNNYTFAGMGELQPIGKPNANIKEYVIDRFGNRLPFGACGELCIAGGQVGNGYLNRPEKTAEAFVKNPFDSASPYDRMYKTGDIVRIMNDGNYVFVGRRDGQVKIRGFRVELSEVEQIIRSYDGIRNVAAQAFDASTGGKFIAAYIVADSVIDIQSLNGFISAAKPDYMVPAVTMQIDEIPLTANGKVDKRRLPKPVVSAKKKGAEPADETEEAICGIFEEVLGIDKVYADDDFFAIGGSSVSAVRVVVKCNNAGYGIVFKNLFANPTPHKLSSFIQGAKDEIQFAPAENEATEYDLSSLNYNKTEYVDEITSGSIGDVLLTGVTGFLGSHILKELLDNTGSSVICLVRGKGDMDGETRFKMMMTYYFEDWLDSEKSERVTVIDGELNDSAVYEKIKRLKFDTIINSAANVKHFAAGDELLRDNFSGVEHLISLAESTGATLIQISSTSVSGEAVEGRASDNYLFRECDLNIGQSLENKYIYSKYRAERAVLDAVSRKRINGKIIRLGNLMARINDSEFQINAGSSAFLKQFSAYKKLKMCPFSVMDKKIEFSPIDATARAVVLLSGTPEKFTVFHAKNCNTIHCGYFISAMKNEGIDISTVSDNVFKKAYNDALNDENGLDDFSTLIAYKSDGGANEKVMHQIDSDTTFTVKALYRLDFAWPLISDEYLNKMVKTLIDLGFF